MSGSSLGNFTIRARFDRMDQIRELNRILNKKDGNIVADNVKVALVRVTATSVMDCV